jgi:hypothetical protein
MLSTIALLALAAIALLLAYAATRPDSFRIARTKVIKAPAHKLHAMINDLKSYNNWNPFERRDPSIQGSYSGPASGVGAAYAWHGRKVGGGSLEIVDSVAPGKVTMRLDFVKPFKAQTTAEFTLQAEGDNLTIVTWALHGPSPFISKLMDVVFNQDRRVGKEFEAGLANLQALTEARSTRRP